MATAIYSRYEYNANIGDMSRAQEAFINYWKGKVSKAALTTTLGGLATTALEKFLIKHLIQLFLPIFIIS